MQACRAVIAPTKLVDLFTHKAAARLIAEHKPLGQTPGSLLCLLDHRCWGSCTDQAGDPSAVDDFTRAHAQSTSAAERTLRYCACLAGDRGQQELPLSRPRRGRPRPRHLNWSDSRNATWVYIGAPMDR